MTTASALTALEAATSRKQVTVLFCDVVGYTRRSTRLDPEDLADDIRVFQSLCAASCARHNGHIVNFLGDGMLVLFGHPRAHEFAPQQAVRAGLEMVAQIQRNNASAEWRGRQPLRIRVGIATGLVVIGERAARPKAQDELIFGETPNLAARLQNIAAPNSVVAALRTRRLVGAAFVFEHLGRRRLKGFAEPLSAWKVLHPRAYRHRAALALKRVRTKFIGRRKELHQMRDCYARSLRGRGRIIHLSGDAGIGKSRLIRAFEKTYAKQHSHRLRIICTPMNRRSRFKPVIAETHRWLQIGANDDAARKRARIHEAMHIIGLADADEHMLFNELLAIPPAPGQSYLNLAAEEKQHRTVRALAEFVLRLSRQHPLLLVVEDLQWADASTLAVLQCIVAAGAREKLFGIFTARTGFTRAWPPGETLREIKLGALDAHSSKRLLESVAGAQLLPPRVQQSLIGKSDGIPLFLEESGWHVLAQLRNAARVQDADAAAPDAFTIPDTLQDSLNARLDQLGDAKALAQLAAVFGGDFCYFLLDTIAAQNGICTDAGMDVLLESDMLMVIQDNNEDRYAFRHAMFQDAAYHSLLKKTRRRYHLQIAECLRHDNPEAGARYPELIAHHYGHGGRVELATTLWLQAGERALAAAAVDEALQHLAQGLKLLPELPTDARRDPYELALRLQLGAVLTARYGYSDARVARAYQRAYALAAAANDARNSWTALYGLWRCAVSQAAFADAMRALVKLRALSETAAEPKQRMTAYGLQGMTRMITGKFIAAKKYYDKAVRLYDRKRDPHSGLRFGQDPYVTIQGLGAVNQLILNNVHISRREIARSVRVARAIGHPYTIAETLRVAAMYHHIAGQWRSLRARAEETVDIAARYGFTGLRAAGEIFLALGAAQDSDGDAACDSEITARIARNLGEYEENYGKLFLPYFQGILAAAHLRLQNFAAAQQAAAAALEIVMRYGEYWYQSALLALQARAAERGNLAPPAEIARARHHGLAIATAQRADLFAQRIQAELDAAKREGEDHP